MGPSKERLVMGLTSALEPAPVVGAVGASSVTGLIVTVGVGEQICL